MKIAAIDIGTNSIRILIADILDAYNLKIITKYNVQTRLGKDVYRTNLLDANAIERTLEALRSFKKEIEDNGVDRIYAIATSAVREAYNKHDFLNQAEEILGVKIEIIAGNMEAYLGYLGAVYGLNINDNKHVCIIDIGGGSTEIAIGSGMKLKKSSSINIGAVRLTEMYPFLSKPSVTDLKKAFSIVKSTFNEQLSLIQHENIDILTAIGGTPTSLAAIDQQLTEYSREKVHGYTLKKEKIVDILKNLVKMSPEERSHVVGLQPQRADIIIGGTIILLCFMELIDVNELIISEYDNLEGLILCNCNNRKP